ncbi:MAG: transketolase [Myxococcota bacterium]
MPIELTQKLRGRIENTIRLLAVDAVQRANSGHPGAPMGLAPAAFELWDRHLRFDPSDPSWPLRDRFVLSAGHASMLLYALLHLYGYDLSMDEIVRFRQLDSKTPGHPEYQATPGVEATTGPLGQGFANAVGMALAGRMAGAHFGGSGEGPGQHFVYAVASDGDLMEGISSEAASLAGHLGLGNLIVLYDDNRVTIDGPTRLSFSEDVAGRFESQGWGVQAIDGHRVTEVGEALERARSQQERPSIIIMRTTIGFGSPNIAGKSKAHGAPLGPEEVKLTKRALGWPEDREFWVPDDVRAYFAERSRGKRAERREADAALEKWRASHPDRAAAWDAARARKTPANLPAHLADGLEGVDDATRNHARVVLERLSEAAPYLVGGSADLAGSAAPPIIKGRGIVGPAAGEGVDPFAGQNIHFGVREHAMAAISNGINLDGTFLGYCGTFLIFSDYMRPAIRLAALMKLPTLFVFTHDSIFLGQDGPTHQPIEQLDSLRAIPRLTLFRPADGLETAMAYAWVLQHAQGPTALALSRQKVPALRRRAPFALEDVYKGAYMVSDSDGKPDVVLLASGSEVSLVCETAEKLSAEGLSARVVSVPCLELLLAQPQSYRDELLPDDGTPLVAVEASRGHSWWRLVGHRGFVYGIDDFGASAPSADLAARFGFTPDALSAWILARLRKDD